MCKSATPLLTSDMKDVFPEAKGGKGNNNENIDGDNMEKFSMLSYFKFRKNARNPGKKHITGGRQFYFNIFKCVGKKVII